VKRLSLALW